ncbi:MAG: tryptophan--tRNA ligase [Pseudomonadota bacterium]
MATDDGRRLVSGMRPAGRLNLADYIGILNSWVQLQQEQECLLFLADWHALAASYAHTREFRQRIKDTLIDWLAVGIDPRLATVFLQSRVPECAELNVLLGMCTPTGWLERLVVARGGEPAAPGLSVQASSLDAAAADGGTVGQLTYPLLQCADILLYQPTHVCVMEEQAAHVEFCRDVAGRFNHLFGREEDAQKHNMRALKSLGKRASQQLEQHRRDFQERGDETALKAGLALVSNSQHLTLGDRDRLIAYLEGGGRSLLSEPEAVVVGSLRLPGTDGRPMAREYENTIELRDEPEVVQRKLRKMPTDPARVRRKDPGNPEKCPVWRYHLRFGDDASQKWVSEGCRGATIGCTDCKARAAEAVVAQISPIASRASELASRPEVVGSIIVEGSERAREIAKDTMRSVRHAMSLT